MAFQVFQRKSYSMASVDTKVKTNRLLGFSLLWLGVAIAFVALLSFSILSIPTLFTFYAGIMTNIGTKPAFFIAIMIISLVANVGIVLYMNRTATQEKPSTFFLAFLFFVFVFINSLWIPLILAIQILQEKGRNILLALLGVGGITTLMGVLGYYQIINFGKLAPLLIILVVAELITGITMFFVTNSIVTTIYWILGFGVSLGFMGYQFWIIREQGAQILAYYNDPKEIQRIFIRIGMLNALNLFVAVVRLFMFILRFLNWRD